jgi:spore maturation protein CgeB
MDYSKGTKIIVIGSSAASSLELSYVRAAQHLGFEVNHFDPGKRLSKYIKGGRFGHTLQTFLPVDAWTRKMNRELAIEVKNYKPDIILLMGPARILFGTIATIKVISNARLVWIWPDTPMNLTPNNFEAASLFDISATYSEKTVPVFKKLGFNNVIWAPLAGDPFLHSYSSQEERKFINDISFVGMWRPEREKVMSFILNKFPTRNIHLYGKYWKRNCTDKALLQKWQGEELIGKELASFFHTSRININVIDDTNYPAANMRFFEVCTAGGLQLTSSCPEMETTFRDNEHLLYFSSEAELQEKIEWAFNNEAETKTIRENGLELINSGHTYTHRLQAILSEL